MARRTEKERDDGVLVQDREIAVPRAGTILDSRKNLLQLTWERSPQLERHMSMWLQEIPQETRKALLRRMEVQPNQSDGFMGAFFELVLHRMLTQFNCCFTYSPEGLADYCLPENNRSFFLEATVCGARERYFGLFSNERNLLNEAGRIIGPIKANIWLHVTASTDQRLGAEDAKQLADQCMPLLDRLPKLSKRISAWRYVASLLETEQHSIQFASRGWEVRACVTTIREQDAEGNVFLWPGNAEGAVDPIRKALSKKRRNWRRKGNTGQPFLIAINICHPHALTGDAEEALLGVGRDQHQGSSPSLASFLDGVNGVIVFSQALPDNLSQSTVRLFRNGGKEIPAKLEFLLRERRIGNLLGGGW